MPIIIKAIFTRVHYSLLLSLLFFSVSVTAAHAFQLISPAMKQDSCTGLIGFWNGDAVIIGKYEGAYIRCDYNTEFTITEDQSFPNKLMFRPKDESRAAGCPVFGYYPIYTCDNTTGALTFSSKDGLSLSGRIDVNQNQVYLSGTGLIGVHSDIIKININDFVMTK